MTDPESKPEQLARLGLMASGDSDVWDLSDNDRAAIRAVLTERAELLYALAITQRRAEGSFAEGWTVLLTGHEMLALRAAIAKADGR